MSDEELKIYMNGFMKGTEAEYNLMKSIIKAKINKLNKMTKEVYKHRKQQRYTLNEIQAIKGVLKELLEGE